MKSRSIAANTTRHDLLNAAGFFDRNGLPSSPMGKNIKVFWSCGSHCGVCEGTVIGVSTSDEGGLQLIIEGIPEIWGLPIYSFLFDSDKKEWRAVYTQQQIGESGEKFVERADATHRLNIEEIHFF